MSNHLGRTGGKDRVVSDATLGAWVLKCDPSVWDIDEFMADGNTYVDAWSVENNYRSRLMANGQPAVLWVSGSKARKVTPGIWGAGHIVGPSEWNAWMSDDNPDTGHWLDLRKMQKAEFSVPLNIELLPSPVSREQFKSDKILAGVEVIRQPQGSNPSFLTKREFASLWRLISNWPDAPEDPGSVVTVGKSGAGFGNSETNAIVEERAMEAVRKHFQALGYLIEDVSAKNLGWDMTVSRNKGVDERHIEVKGVSGDTQKVLLTKNEMLNAKTNQKWELAIVTSALTKRPLVSVWTAREVTDAGEPFAWQVDLNH